MYSGKIKFFTKVGYGMVIPDSGTRRALRLSDTEDVYFHQADSESGLSFQPQARVTFEVKEAPRGPRAINIALEPNFRRHV